jgi:hypothetical protein
MWTLIFSGLQVDEKSPRRPTTRSLNPPGGKSSGIWWSPFTKGDNYSIFLKTFYLLHHHLKTA